VDIAVSNLAGESILSVQTDAPGDGNSIGGGKVIAENGWFAARPSGTEEIYKIYAESFESEQHLCQIQAEAESIVTQALSNLGIAPASQKEGQ
jgi:phosphoglucomutase